MMYLTAHTTQGPFHDPGYHESLIPRTTEVLADQTGATYTANKPQSKLWCKLSYSRLHIDQASCTLLLSDYAIVASPSNLHAQENQL